MADVESRLERSKTGPGWMIALRWPEGEALVEVSYMPAYRLENVAAATAACYAAGLPVAQCVQGIKEVRFSAGRGEVMRLPGICLIDDTYNANPAAVRAALDNLVRLADEEGGRAVAVLGDMLELGPESERYHWETGRYAADIGVRGLWGVGSLARGIAEGFRGTWVARKDAGGDWVAGHVDSAGEASSVVEGLRAGDVILFKASRAVKLESMVSVVAALAEAGAWTGNAGVVADETGRQEEVGPCSN